MRKHKRRENDSGIPEKEHKKNLAMPEICHKSDSCTNNIQSGEALSGSLGYKRHIKKKKHKYVETENDLLDFPENLDNSCDVATSTGDKLDPTYIHSTKRKKRKHKSSQSENIHSGNPSGINRADDGFSSERRMHRSNKDKQKSVLSGNEPNSRDLNSLSSVELDIHLARKKKRKQNKHKQKHKADDTLVTSNLEQNSAIFENPQQPSHLTSGDGYSQLESVVERGNKKRTVDDREACSQLYVHHKKKKKHKHKHKDIDDLPWKKHREKVVLCENSQKTEAGSELTSAENDSGLKCSSHIQGGGGFSDTDQTKRKRKSEEMGKLEQIPRKKKKKLKVKETNNESSQKRKKRKHGNDVGSINKEGSHHLLHKNGQQEILGEKCDTLERGVGRGDKKRTAGDGKGSSAMTKRLWEHRNTEKYAHTELKRIKLVLEKKKSRNYGKEESTTCRCSWGV
jgi:hypothetical protein